MFEHDEKQFADVNQTQPEANVAQAPVSEAGEVNGTQAEAGGWRVEAGRKGAQRIHQLIEHGKLYEQEHGLKSGRQRLRQLIEEGKLYEQEHGLAPQRRRARA